MLKNIYGLLRQLVVYVVVMVVIYCCVYIYIPRSSHSGSLYEDHELRHGDVDHKSFTAQNDSGPVYVIMPTYHRSNQRSLLVMQTQVLTGARGAIHLILTEESTSHSPWIKELLEASKLNFTHLVMIPGQSCLQKPCARGSFPRNYALRWLKESGVTHGVIYFADDDNFYDVNLFHQIKTTRRVSMFPVGGFKKTWISSPVVKNSRIMDFIDSWKAGRLWPVDMAGFAVSVQHWLKQGSPLFSGKKGFLETRFLESLNITRDSVEILAYGATKIMVWHNSLRSVPCDKGTIKQAASWDDTKFKILKNYLAC